MHRDDSQTDSGLIKIHKHSIASIAAIAAAEIEGVKAIAQSWLAPAWELLGKKPAGAIRVEFDKNQEVRLAIPLVIRYGFNIPDVAGKVQENVRASLEKMTSLDIKDISISVAAIERE